MIWRRKKTVSQYKPGLLTQFKFTYTQWVFLGIPLTEWKVQEMDTHNPFENK